MDVLQGGHREESESPRDGCFLFSSLKMVKSLFNEFTAAPLGPAAGTPALFSVPNGSWGRGSMGKQLTSRSDSEHSMPTVPSTS